MNRKLNINDILKIDKRKEIFYIKKTIKLTKKEQKVTI